MKIKCKMKDMDVLIVRSGTKQNLEGYAICRVGGGIKLLK